MEINSFLIFIIVDLIILAAIGFTVWILNRRYQKSVKLKAELLLSETTEKAKMIELEARDKALKVLQNTEAETSKMRTEIS